MRLGLHVTDRCQLDCQHCLRDPGLEPSDLPLALITSVLDQAAQEPALRHVSLTGGEPTLYPQLDELVTAIAERGWTWDFVTNARRLGAHLQRWRQLGAPLRALSVVVLSLDAATEARHDALREQGSYREVMAGAAACAAQGVPFGLQMTVHARNQAELEQVGLLAGLLGARHVSYCMLQATGTPLDASLRLSPEQWRQVRQRLEKLGTVLKLPIVLQEGHYEEAPQRLCAPLREETLHVDVHGRLSLCCLHAGVPATEPDDDVAADLRTVPWSEARQRLRQLIARSLELGRADALARPSGAWAHFSCNECLRRHGRPHWTAEGSAGPPAHRERWRGAWAPETRANDPLGRRRLPVVPS